MIRRLWATVAISAISGSCAAPSPPAPAAVVSAPPPAASSVAAAPVPSTSASIPTPSEQPGLVSSLTAEQREELQELRAICPTGIYLEAGRLLVGCTACPNGEPPTGQATVEASPDDLRLNPATRLKGAFLEKGADERLLVFYSCSCAGCLDEAFVLRSERDAKYSLRARVALEGSDTCRLVRRPGQVDRALCQRTVARHGYRAITLSLYDFRGAGTSGEDARPSFRLLALNNVLQRCFAGARYAARSIDSWRLEDVDGDGQEDLEVALEVGDGVVSKAMAQAGCEASGNRPKPRPFVLRWTADSSGFKPTAATAAELRALARAEKEAQP